MALLINRTVAQCGPWLARSRQNVTLLIMVAPPYPPGVCSETPSGYLKWQIGQNPTYRTFFPKCASYDKVPLIKSGTV